MHTKTTLIEDFHKSGIRHDGTLLIHSSMKSIGDVDGGADTVIDAFSEYMQEGLLLFPTHSWSESNLKDGIYDLNTEPSCLGILPNLFMKKEDVIRSKHPTHSVTALGKRAKEYTQQDDEVYTPCPVHGCFGGLYDEEAQILFLGAPLNTNTYIHSIEERMNIPYRLRDKPRIISIVEEPSILREIEFYGHYNEFGDISENYDKVRDAILFKGIGKKIRIGDATCYLIDVKPFTNLMMSFLKKDPDLFIDHKPIPKEWYQEVDEENLNCLKNLYVNKGITHDIVKEALGYLQALAKYFIHYNVQQKSIDILTIEDIQGYIDTLNKKSKEYTNQLLAFANYYYVTQNNLNYDYFTLLLRQLGVVDENGKD